MFFQKKVLGLVWQMILRFQLMADGKFYSKQKTHSSLKEFCPLFKTKVISLDRKIHYKKQKKGNECFKSRPKKF
jgi:hypothetical protein